MNCAPARMQFYLQVGQETTMQFVVALLSQIYLTHAGLPMQTLFN